MRRAVDLARRVVRTRALMDGSARSPIEVKRENRLRAQPLQAALVAEAFRMVGEGVMPPADSTARRGRARPALVLHGPVRDDRLNAPAAFPIIAGVTSTGSRATRPTWRRRRPGRAPTGRAPPRPGPRRSRQRKSRRSRCGATNASPRCSPTSDCNAVPTIEPLAVFSSSSRAGRTPPSRRSRDGSRNGSYGTWYRHSPTVRLCAAPLTRS